MAQFIVVDQVLVAKRDADDALRYQRLHAVLYEVTVAAVFEARSQPARQTKDAIGGSQQHGAGIGGDPATVKRGDDRAAFDGCKIE